MRLSRAAHAGRVRRSCSTSIIRSACSASTSLRWTPTSRWAAATSTCAAGRRGLPLRASAPSRAAGTSTLDIGWFAKESRSFTRAGSAALRDGGDAWLESTPPVLTYYQARAGQPGLYRWRSAWRALREHSRALQRRPSLGARRARCRGHGRRRGSRRIRRCSMTKALMPPARQRACRALASRASDAGPRPAHRPLPRYLTTAESSPSAQSPPQNAR